MTRRKFAANSTYAGPGGHRAPRDQSLRRHIAYAAARLIAEEGLTDYLAAKMKAAHSLGCGPKEVLPDNHEIEAALREHLAIFQRDSQPQELRELREIALEVMRRLLRFSPLLVGPIFTGTANRFSIIELEVVVEDEKALDLFLLKENVAYEVVARGSGNLRKQRRVYEFSFGNVPIMACAFMSASERAQHGIHGTAGNDHADLAGVRALLQAT